MKKFFLSLLALASMAGVAVAQEVVATIDYSKVREYPYGEQNFTIELNNGAIVLTNGHDWPQCTLISDVPVQANTTYTLTVAMKGDRKGAANIVFGNWEHEFYGSTSPLSFTDKWEKCSTVIEVGDDVGETSMIRMQPNNYADEMSIAWVVVSKGDAEPESTPLMPVSLDDAEVDAEIDFSKVDAYTYDGENAELVDGVLINTGSDFFNVMEGLTLDPELDYGVVARVKSSEDTEVSVSLGDWGVMVDGSFLATDMWKEVIVRLGNAAVDDSGRIPESSFLMFSPADDYEGTIEVEWVKLINFVEPEPEPEPVYEIVWNDAIVNLTGDDGESEHVYTRIDAAEPQEGHLWDDVIAGVCDNPAGEGQVFYGNVAAHPYPENPDEDPIVDHATQFFVYFPEYVLQEGDRIKISFDYYSSIERRIDTQAHCTPGDYNHWSFIGTFTSKPEWQHYEYEGEITADQAGKGKGCSTVTLNLATRDNDNMTDMPESIFYMNNINVAVGINTLVSGEEPVEPEREWVSIITNGDANVGESENCISRVNGDDVNAPVVDNPAGEGKVFEAPIIEHPLKGEEGDNVNDWDSQFFIVFNQPLEEGTQVKVSFDYYCSDERTINTQAHGNPGNYSHWEMVGDLNAKPEWQSLSKELTISADQAKNDGGCKAIAFNLATAKPSATFYVNNVKVEALLEKGGETAVEEIEITPVPAVENGRIVVYNLLGVKVLDTDDASMLTSLKKGIYIINGKKVAL